MGKLLTLIKQSGLMFWKLLIILFILPPVQTATACLVMLLLSIFKKLFMFKAFFLWRDVPLNLELKYHTLCSQSITSVA